MGEGLVKNLLFVCCFMSSLRVLLVLVYLEPEGAPPEHESPVGYSIVRREYAVASVNDAAANVSIIGYHDDSDEARKEIKQEAEVRERIRREEYDNDEEQEEIVADAIPANVVSQNFDVMPAGGCPEGGRGIFLLTLVHSLPPHFTQRDAIRETWARNASAGTDAHVHVLFVSPGVSPRPEVMSGLKKEGAHFDDIIHSVAGDSVSTFRPSSKVLLSMMGWALNYCSRAKFVLFAHDEHFINFPLVVQRLRNVPRSNMRTFTLGRVKKSAKVERDSMKWNYVPESIFSRATYPDYCVGGAGFVVSTAFLKQVHPKAVKFNREVNTFPASDVMLGIVTHQLNASPKYHEEFHKSGGEADYCDLRDTLTLGDFDTPEKIRSSWRNHTAKMDYCPSPVPSETEITQWTKDVNHEEYFKQVFQFIHKPVAFCKGQNVSLLALVSTHPSNFNLRSAIRVTWGSPEYTAPLNVRVLFVLGRARTETPELVNGIRAESEKFGDIIQADFQESFHNLTLKVILGLRWVASECPTVRYVYKGDDDMLVNFDHIIGYVDQLPAAASHSLFMGNLMSMSPAIRTESKYQVRRDVYPFKYFLPYFSGGGYIMSGRVIQAMAPLAQKTKLIPIDDAYAGILAFRAGIQLKHAGGFIVGGSKRDACRLRRAFNMHGFKRTTPFIGTWKTFRDPKNRCEEDHKKNIWSHIA